MHWNYFYLSPASLFWANYYSAPTDAIRPILSAYGQLSNIWKIKNITKTLSISPRIPNEPRKQSCPDLRSFLSADDLFFKSPLTFFSWSLAIKTSRHAILFNYVCSFLPLFRELFWVFSRYLMSYLVSFFIASQLICHFYLLSVNWYLTWMNEFLFFFSLLHFYQSHTEQRRYWGFWISAWQTSGGCSDSASSAMISREKTPTILPIEGIARWPIVFENSYMLLECVASIQTPFSVSAGYPYGVKLSYPLSGPPL